MIRSKFGLVIAIMLVFAACDKHKDAPLETVIAYEDLPDAGKSMIASNFGSNAVIKVSKKKAAGSDGTLYETWLKNNFEIDFDANGNWTDIDGGQQPVPGNLIPPKILQYVQQHYPAPVFIKGIDKEPYGYEVELSNDVDLKFSGEGQLLSVDHDSDDRDDEVVVTASSLPQTAKALLETYYKGIAVAEVKKNRVADEDGSLYEVKLANGIEIDFDISGNWISIDGNHTKLPDGLIPPAVLTFVQQRYPAPLFVEGVEKEIYGYKVEVSNDVDLKFNSAGVFLGVDD